MEKEYAWKKTTQKLALICKFMPYEDNMWTIYYNKFGILKESYYSTTNWKKSKKKHKCKTDGNTY